MKKNNKKGFTLAELLVVVAIIAVLVAIAIPVFSASQTRAEHAVDLANVRSAYAETLIDSIADGATTSSGDIEVSIATLQAACENGSTVSGKGTKVVTVKLSSYEGTFDVDDDVILVD